MLSQLKEGRYFIEEPEANIELDFSHAVVSSSKEPRKGR